MTYWGCFKSPFSHKKHKKNAKSARFLILIINALRSLREIKTLLIQPETLLHLWKGGVLRVTCEQSA
ncbi:MAG: hypothetical protein LBS50_00960 [Prevotellaceae bacterium]|nr:hypothetical protein [Prevotellaceae bacterium]